MNKLLIGPMSALGQKQCQKPTLRSQSDFCRYGGKHVVNCQGSTDAFELSLLALILSKLVSSKVLNGRARQEEVCDEYLGRASRNSIRPQGFCGF